MDQVTQARLIHRMYHLFKSNKRSFGLWDPGTNANVTGHRAYTEADFASHFYGESGLGLVPIDDAAACYWGAIDLDNHGDDEDLPINVMAKKVADLKLPLIACRSKSGGIHLYTFYSEPVPAEMVRRKLVGWATMLGHGTAEVFPKQSRLLKDRDSPGGLQLGNYINLPYFRAEDTNRYAKIWDQAGVRQLDIGEFLDEAEKIAQIEDAYANAKASDHPEAPPCLQRMLTVGVAEGYRNEALFGFAVYLRKSHPEDWRDRARDINAQVFEQPMPESEVKKVLGSVGRRVYRYRCSQEPCKSLCDSAKCLTRVYGIKPTEVMSVGDPDKFELLRRVDTDPPRWLLRVNGQDVPLTTEQLMRYANLELKVLEHSSLVLRPMKPDEWRVMLSDLMRNMATIEVPKDASTSGQMLERLVEYLHKAIDGRKMSEVDKGRTLDVGRPIRIARPDGEWIAFKGSEFTKHLKRTKSEDMKGPELWLALRNMGVEHDHVTWGTSSHRIWLMPYSDVMEMLDMSAPDPGVDV